MKSEMWFTIGFLVVLFGVLTGVVLILNYTLPDKKTLMKPWCDFYAERVDRLTVAEEWEYLYRCKDV